MLFYASAVKYPSSDGRISGAMNHTADQWLKDNNSGEKKPRGIFRRLMSRPFLVLGVIVVGLACLLLAVFVFDAHRTAPISLLSALKIGPKVFRKKLPEEIKIAQNLFRGKMPAVDQPVNPQTKIESMPPVEKTTGSSQPIVAAPEKNELQGESGPDRRAEPQIAVETAPAVVKAVPAQSTDAPPEKDEPRRDSEPDQPTGSQITIETTPAPVKAMPSQPTDAPSEKSEALGESEPDRPAEPQITIETTPPVAKAVLSQPTDAPSEKSEAWGESEPDQLAEPQIKIETTVLPAEEQSISSQPTVAPSEQKELTVNAERRQAAVRPPPVMDGASQKTEKRNMRSEKWLLTQKSSYYTIQLMGARKEALLFDFVTRNNLLEQNEIAFYQTKYKEKPWFQLLYGVYTTKKDAQSAADYLPPNIRKSSPWIRRLSSIQKAIRNNAAQ
jgi:septal ring-binding cell division protein DamX